LVYDSFIENWEDFNARHEMEQYINLSMEVPDAVLAAYDGILKELFRL